MIEYILQIISGAYTIIWLWLFIIGLVYMSVKIGWKSGDDEDYK